MAYRKTEEMLDAMEKRKLAMFRATYHLLAQDGRITSTLAVARRAKLSEALIFKYFADKNELLAAAVAPLVANDVELLRSYDLADGLRAWAKELASNYALMSVVGTMESYKVAIKSELRRLLREAGATSGAIECAVLYGAVLEAAGSLTPQNTTALLASLMRAVGVRISA